MIVFLSQVVECVTLLIHGRSDSCISKTGGCTSDAVEVYNNGGDIGIAGFVTAIRRDLRQERRLPDEPGTHHTGEPVSSTRSRQPGKEEPT